MRSVVWLQLGVAVTFGAACGAVPGPGAETRLGVRARDGSRRTPSNLLRGDYAGSRACEGCHADIAEPFVRSAMHNMTRDAATATVQAPFEGAVFRFKDDTATFTSDGAGKTIHVVSPRFGDHRYRVTKIIGGRHREDFAGIEMDGDGRARGDEEILPVSWVVGRKAFRYKGYSVMSEERPGLKSGPVWRETCIFCHNTVPYLSTILGALAPEKTPAFQGATVDRFLPAAARLTYAVTRTDDFRNAVADEISFLRGSSGSPAARAVVATELPDDAALQAATLVAETRMRFGSKSLIELGIGCESCHGGARAHADDPRVLPSYAPVSPVTDIRLPELAAHDRAPLPPDERARWIDRTCARCHQVLFSGYTPTWEGGLRSREPGGSHINSGEARDFLLGACASALSCTTCHDPHGRPKHAAAFAGGFANREGDAVCTSCHSSLGTDAARAAHAHHRAEGEGSHCVACHMPRKNMGLDGKLTRYHRIASPNDPLKVERDRPLECALCHTDKTVVALIGDMERFWPKRFDRTRLTALYGRLDDNVILSTLGRGRPHEQAVAIALLGERRDRSAAPLIVEMLGHKYPLIREYARDALESIAGAALPVDLHREKSVILEDARTWREREIPLR